MKILADRLYMTISVDQGREEQMYVYGMYDGYVLSYRANINLRLM